MAVWSYTDTHDYGVFYVESETPPQVEGPVTKESEKSVYLVEHYRLDAYEKTRYFEQKVFQQKKDAELRCERANSGYSEDEDCEWKAQVVVAPLV